MGKGLKKSKKAIPGAKNSTSVSFHSNIFKRSKAKKAKLGATKTSCPILAKAAQTVPLIKSKPLTTALKGVYGEYISDAYMVQLGHTKLNGKPTQIGDSPIGNGLDGVWKGASPPPDYIVTETKYGSSDLGDTQDGVQMSDNWIANRLNGACGLVNGTKVKTAMATPNSVQKLIIHVDNNGVKRIEKLN